MSWLCRRSGLSDSEWNLLRFCPSRSEVFTAWKQHDNSDPDQIQTKVGRWTELWDENDWDRFLNERNTNQSVAAFNCIDLVLGGRNSALEELPFTKKTFSDIQAHFKVHGSIVRTINRNTTCNFSAVPFNWDQEDNTMGSIVYNCKTTATWEDGMALSVTFFPESLTSKAVWYGCNLKERDIYGRQLTDSEIITKRLADFDGKAYHPMLLPVILADMERNRHAIVVRGLRQDLMQRVFDIEVLQPLSADFSITDESIDGFDCDKTATKSSRLRRLRAKLAETVCDRSRGGDWKLEPGLGILNGKSSKSPSSSNSIEKPARTPLENHNGGGDDGDDEDEESITTTWVKSSCLKNELEKWKRQLGKMAAHADELDDINFGINDAGNRTNIGEDVAALQECGSRIKGRLQDLIIEYDNFIWECQHITDGMSLVTQLHLNVIGRKDAMTNLKVARSAQRDGKRMKYIALLGMIYLPATFVSTFFSMGFFQWRRNNESDVMSSDFWIYAVVTLVFTLVTIMSFWVASMRRKKQVHKDAAGSIV